MYAKSAVGLAEALTAAGFPAHWADDVIVATNPATSETFHIRLDPIAAALAHGLPFPDIVATVIARLHDTIASTTAFQAATPDQLMDRLTVHLTPYATPLGRAVAPGLYETLVLDFPDSFLVLPDDRALADWPLSVDAVWARAVAQRAAHRRPADATRPIGPTARLHLWAGPDAADQAWTWATTEPFALLALPASETAVGVTAITTEAEVAPLLHWVSTAHPEAFDHPLLPGVVLAVGDGVVTQLFHPRLPPSLS